MSGGCLPSPLSYGVVKARGVTCVYVELATAAAILQVTRDYSCPPVNIPHTNLIVAGVMETLSSVSYLRYSVFFSPPGKTGN